MKMFKLRKVPNEDFEVSGIRYYSLGEASNEDFKAPKAPNEDFDDFGALERGGNFHFFSTPPSGSYILHLNISFFLLPPFP